MLTQSERFLRDLRAAGGWIAALALTALLVAGISTYMAAFSINNARGGVLSATSPRESLSFLRVVDLGESMIHEVDGNPVGEEPEVKVLMSELANDDRMFMVLDLHQVAYRFDSAERMNIPDATAVIGTAPDFVPQAPQEGLALLWGDLATAGGNRIGDLDVSRVASRPLESRFVSSDGRIVQLGEKPTVALTPKSAERFGLSGIWWVSEVVNGVTCYCTPDELAGTADLMNEAAAAAGKDRVYYAVGYEDLIGTVQRSYGLRSTLNTAHLIATAMGIWCFAAMAAAMMWRRRSHTYQVEMILGSSESGLQVRQQALVFLSFTLPMLTGYELVDVILRRADDPPPIPADWRLGVYGVLALLHVAISTPTILRIHRLYEHPAEARNNA
ncbi:hypothetical protein [Kribbella deserti]|uniref:ABC transporter permease n=1 Tax=Kribbella deserti TaxID=1926257 RepID=A0ABV6QL86_9ACTN